MNDIIEQPPKQIVNVNLRKVIAAIEAKIKAMPGALGEDPFPLKHSFAKGVYVREIRIPKGYFVVGKLHKDTYLNCILSGDMSVLTEEGVKRIKGPCWNIAPEGTKRFGYSHEDTVWVTAHANPDEIRDIPTLESMIHARDYDEIPAVIDCEEANFLMNELTFDVERFRALTREIFDHEKDGFWSDWTKEQQELYMSGDWEAFSRSRGYTESEIDTLREWIRVKEDGEARGINVLDTIRDLSLACALKNIEKDTKGEIMLSSHIPTSKKVPYERTGLCQA